MAEKFNVENKEEDTKVYFWKKDVRKIKNFRDNV